MTRDEIRNATHGQLRVWVATEVMGWTIEKEDGREWLRSPDGTWGGAAAMPIETVPDYPNDWRAAGEVVEKFRRGDLPGRHVACCVEIHIYDALCPEDTEVALYSPTLAKVSAMGREFPEAMCRAALLTTLEAEK